MPKKSPRPAETADEAGETPSANELMVSTTTLMSSSSADPEDDVEDLIQRIIKSHQACVVSTAATLKHALAAGIALASAQLQLGHGNFLAWVHDTFARDYGLSERTAQRYMQLAEHADELRAFLRGGHPTCVSDVADDDPFLRVSINQALRIVAKIKQNRQPKSTPKRPRALPLAPWAACRTPEVVAQRVQRFLGTIDCFLSTVDEDSPVPLSGTGADSPAACLPGALHGRVFVNAVARNATEDVLAQIHAAWHGQKVIEACVLLPSASDAAWSRDTANLPRVCFASRLTVRVLVNGVPEEMRLPTSALLLYFGAAERVSELASCFADIATTFVPCRDEAISVRSATLT